MSDKTYDAIDDAIRAHLIDEGDPRGILTDWYLIAAVADEAEADKTNYLHIATRAPMHTLHGLVSLAYRRMLFDTRPEEYG